MKRLSLALLVLIFLVTGLFQTGIHSVQAQLDETSPCVPGSGWRWTAGPSLPEMAERARQALAEQGIIVVVKATGYGEVDSCGAYQPFGVDFILTTLEETPLVIRQDPIRAALAEAAGARIGRIVMEGRSGEQVLTSAETPSLSPRER